jgi:hypothetical protein
MVYVGFDEANRKLTIEDLKVGEFVHLPEIPFFRIWSRYAAEP